jgi:hypothetical protein
MRILLLAISALCLSACQNDYMQIVETKATNAKLDNDHYVYETDALKITYQFWHDQGLMSFTIYNKLNTPLYIDWSKSSLIYNGSKLNYWVSENKSEATAYYGKYFYNGPLMAPGYNVSEEIGVANSNSFSTKEKTTFIPPKSNYYRSQFRFMSEEFIPIDKSKFEMVTSNEDETKKTKVYSAQYDKNNTPLSLRNFISVSKSEKAEDEFFIDNEFYVSAVQSMYIGHALGKYKKTTNEKGEKLFDLPYKKNTSFYILHYDVNKVEGLSNDKYSTKKF